MFPFSKKEPEQPYNGLPRWDIAPETKGRWKLRKREYFINIGGSICGFYYMKDFEVYNTKEEAEADVIHLGWSKEDV